jgi:hypothetical protein
MYPGSNTPWARGPANLKGFGSAKRVLAAAWVGFARSPCRENARFESAKRALAAAWARFSQNMTNWHEKTLIGVRL